MDAFGQAEDHLHISNSARARLLASDIDFKPDEHTWASVVRNSSLSVILSLLRAFGKLFTCRLAGLLF